MKSPSHITLQISKNKVSMEFTAQKGFEMPGDKRQTIRGSTVCFSKICFNVLLKSTVVCPPSALGDRILRLGCGFFP